MKIFSVITSPYIHFIENLMISMEKSGVNEKLNIYCLDQTSYDYFHNTKKYPYTYYYDLGNKFPESMLGWGDNNTYAMFTILRHAITHDLLSQGFDILHVDGDIAFRKDPIQYLENLGKDSDIVFQNDTIHEGSLSLLCPGFFYARSTEQTKNLFDPQNIIKCREQLLNRGDVNHQGVGYWADQEVIMRMIKESPNLRIKVLPLKLFPNGHFNKPGTQLGNMPYIIHYNAINNHDKVARMKKDGDWYLN